MLRIIGADGREYGPVSIEQVKQWIAEGRANAQSKVLAEGEIEWKPLGTLRVFANEFAIQPVPTTELFPAQRTNGFALTSLILGIFAMTIGLCCCYGFPFNVAGVVFSILGLIQIKNAQERYSGRGMAIAGLILSIISVLLGIGLVLFGVAMGWEEIMKEIKRL